MASASRDDEGYLASKLSVRYAAEKLSQLALQRIREPSGRARVEDFLAVLGSITGEAALLAGLAPLDIETANLTPGSSVFGPQINEILTGDQPDPDVAPPNSVLGILVREVVPVHGPLVTRDEILRIYQLTASSVGSVAWGRVAVSVGRDHAPVVLPIQVAFELRDQVDAAQQATETPPNLRHVPCALALALGLQQVASSIDIRVATTLALEVTFGVAKMTPMSRTAFARVAAKPH